MPIVNNNKAMLDQMVVEQLPFIPVTPTAGSSFADDNERFIYAMLPTSTTAAQFWRFDTWRGSWQQLASPPSLTITTGQIKFTRMVGGVFSGNVFGSIYSFQANGTVAYWYKYDIATHTWSTLSIATVPATFGTDCAICFPSPRLNGWDGNYHAGVTKTITLNADLAVGATSATVLALPTALPAGAILRFGEMSITTTAAIAKGAISLPVAALSNAIASGVRLDLADGRYVYTTAAVAAGATAIPISPASAGIQTGTSFSVPLLAVLTAAAAANATDVTLAAQMISVVTASTSLWYDHMYLVGSNAAVMYRYSLSANLWYTTSANAGNPAIPAITGTVGLGGKIEWLPSTAAKKEKLWIVRGGATSTVYMYDLVSNSFSTETYYPATETFTTGTYIAVRQIANKNAKMILQKDATMRLRVGDPQTSTLEPMGTQYLYPTSTAITGDRLCCLTSPDGVEFIYMGLHSSAAFVRMALLD